MSYNPNNPNGQAAMANSAPVVVASDQSAIPVSGTVAVTSATLATTAKQDTGNASLSSIDTKTPALGQALAADSVPVVLTAAQLSTLTPPAAITGYATETTLGTRLSESDFDTKTGSLTEAAPASDTASSGLNGRLQRIAQRLTSLIALLPTSLGQKTMANSLGVAIASDQSTLTTQGGKTNNNAAPGDTNLGVLPAVANAATQSWTEGNQAALSVDLSGNTRIVANDETASGNITTQNLVPTGTATANSAVEISIVGKSLVAIQVTGTYTGALTPQVTVNGTTWVSAAGGSVLLNMASGAYSATISSATQGIFIFDCAGFNKFRISANAAVTGTAAVTLRASAATGMVSLDNALPAGTESIGNIATVSTVTTVSTLTGAGVAHDGADSGNPHKMGARATNVEISSVSANNDRTDLVATMTGKLIVQPFSNPENLVSGAITTAMTGTTSTSLIAAPGAGLRNYITQITVSNSHATVGTDVAIQDGSGGTTLYTIPATANYGGATITFPVPLRQPTTNTALYCANVTTGSSIKVSASGYKAA